MAANHKFTPSTNHITETSQGTSSINLSTLSGKKIVQKVVTVGGRQVVLTGSTSNTGISNSLKRTSIGVLDDESPKKTQCLISGDKTSTQRTKHIVSILPSEVKSPSRAISVSSKSHIKTEYCSPVKLISLNASANSPKKTMQGASTVLNFGSTGNKATRFTTSSLGGIGGDSKIPTYTLSPQKVYVKGQSTSVKGGATAYTHHGGDNAVQPISVSGSKFQYVRLVPTSQGQPSGSKMANIAPTPSPVQRTIAPAGSQSSSASLKVPIMPSIQANKSSHQTSQQRLILPATTQVPIRPNLGSNQQQYGQLSSIPGGAQALTQLPPGTTIISSGQNIQGVQGFALVPAQYVQQLQQTFTTQQSAIQSVSTPNFSNSSYSSKDFYEQRSANTQTQRTSASADGSNSQGGRGRKPCNCTKSQCLKLYCECFANGEFCSGCNCCNCYNNLDHEDDRARAIKQCLDRNPQAFRPKIGTGKERNTSGNRRHNKGCNCKRSGCLKNYCECYEAKILCTHLCKCVGCKNFEESPEKKTLMHLADAAEVRVQQQTAAKCKLSSQIEDVPSRTSTSSGERLPYSFVTSEVAEATCSCLIAQAEEAERTKQIDIVQEKLILEEFGRCLMQVIESSNRTKDSSSNL